ncbi:SAM-dependent methyltransferase [Rhodovibrio sodomensis]|uniref:SAM-dependent methyltransferase n=1 Tax=Rhodovibrio sodomensis TaxID=1088 RepID=A0ABS1DBZ4_9PROT|nr:class I SAM-dependent methyltransferase [Rhodovibrio sodomensis]MBK1667978.1 SAM-dependent methyltransferase [Rhodovibrio sodomensis]
MAPPSGPAAPPPSDWICRFAGHVPTGPVLDLACGRARHGRLFRARGHPVTLVDRDLSGVADLAGRDGVETLQADLEDGRPFPLAGRGFAGVVATNYLSRPLLPALVAAVQPGGVLLYETFARGQARLGRPTNPAFLLAPGELLEAVRGALTVVAYEDRTLHRPDPACVQRICAVRPTA